MFKFIKDISLPDNVMGESLWTKLQSPKDILIENAQENTDFTEAIKLINNSASQVASQSFNTLNEATGEVTNKLMEASDSVLAKTEYLTDKASQVVSTFTDTAGNSISQLANQSVDVLTQTTGEVTNKLMETSDAVLAKTSYLTDKAVSTATQTAEKAQSSLNETLQQTEQFQNSLTHIVQDPIDFAIKSLISNHPIITWFLRHPLLTAIAIIVVVLLVLSMINMIIQLPQQLLSTLLFSPLTIGVFLLRKVFKPINSVSKNSNVTIPRAAKHNQKEISKDILSQLDKIRQGQEKLSQQMNAIISTFNGKSEGMEILQEDLTQN